jgi:HAD superfamily hydrolase (TIGR01509 family)
VFAFSSHQVGLCKPHPDIYKVAIDRAKVSSPEAMVFFDDLATNVEAAKSAGMRAYQVRGVAELRARLMSERLL